MEGGSCLPHVVLALPCTPKDTLAHICSVTVCYCFQQASIEYPWHTNLGLAPGAWSSKRRNSRPQVPRVQCSPNDSPKGFLKGLELPGAECVCVCVCVQRRTRGSQEASWRRQAGGHRLPETSVPGSFPVSVYPQSLFTPTASASGPGGQVPPTFPSPQPLCTHLLQRPWDRCALLPAVLGREHF